MMFITCSRIYLGVFDVDEPKIHETTSTENPLKYRSEGYLNALLYLHGATKTVPELTTGRRLHNPIRLFHYLLDGVKPFQQTSSRRLQLLRSDMSLRKAPACYEAALAVYFEICRYLGE
ncbi:hypothetical protein [Paenibacillus sp. UNC496MF]|uniref:hypothetical protein n=1 Tax=Paenibacillus sp. UNC496MF TaxID=1502753 RepID=UPI001160A8E0|nr:hypothetical protein [Paenibacillus sp. UNC496MF]